MPFLASYMNLGSVLMLIAVVTSSNVSATLIMAGNQINAFAQSGRNTGNVTSSSLEERITLNLEERNARSDPDTNDRIHKSSPSQSQEQSVSEQDSGTLNDESVQQSIQPQIDTSTISPNTGSSNIEEVDRSSTSEVGSSIGGSASTNDVGSTGSNSNPESQKQETANEIPVKETDQQRNIRGEAAYNTLLGLGINSVAEATKKMLNSIPKAVGEHYDDVLAASQNPELRALGTAKWLTFLAGQRAPILDSMRLLQVGGAIQPAPNCLPGDPSCTPPPPTQEPANCNPLVTGSCFPISGNSPCSPAQVSGATCTSGDITCTQTPLKHDISCAAKYPDGTFWQAVYFTPPANKPQFQEILCTPNPTPPPFNNCVTTNHEH